MRYFLIIVALPVILVLAETVLTELIVVRVVRVVTAVTVVRVVTLGTQQLSSPQTVLTKKKSLKTFLESKTFAPTFFHHNLFSQKM